MTETAQESVEIPSEQNTEPAETPSSESNEFDRLEDQLVGIKPSETEATETTQDEPDKQEEETPKKYTFKADGQDVEVESEDKLIELARKGYTWDERVKKLSEERKSFETEREQFTNEKSLLYLENLAAQVGTQRKEPVLDVYGDAYENLVTKYGKEKADKYLETHELISDTADFAMAQQEYNSWTESARTVLENRRKADEENSRNIEAFKSKYQISDEEMTEIIKKANDFIGYSVSKGQKPLPSNAFEVFHRGMNFDSLLKAETDKLNAEWEKKFKEEREKLIDELKGKRPIKTTPVRKTVKQPIEQEEDEITQMENRLVGL